MTTTAYGAGADTLTLQVSGTQYQGVMPTFAVSVDGVPVGQPISVTADHFLGQSDTIQLHGAWGPGAHAVAVNFLNDGYNPAADWSNPAAARTAEGNDRNLFVESAAYDGHVITGATQAIYGGVVTATGTLDTSHAVTTGVLDTAAQAVADATLQAHAGSNVFTTTPDELLAAGISAADLAAYQEQLNEAVAASGFDPSIYAPGTPDPNNALTAVDSSGFDFNGQHYAVQYVEDFGNDSGLFANTWGNVTAGGGSATAAALNSGEFSGLMVTPTGPSAGFGYGLYVLAGDVSPWQPGSYFCLWPASNQWPGPEIDLVEIISNGLPYGTQHWDKQPGVDGGGADDGSRSTIYTGVDPSQAHFYWVDWEAGRLTLGVDDEVFFTTTENVTADFAYGGENAVPGIGSKFLGTPVTSTLDGFVYATPTASDTDLTLGSLTDHPLI